MDKPLVMGILNVTPDSFSDGGQYNQLDAALIQTEQMQLDGADWLDIGGESTRPGAAAVTEAQELDRVIPIVDAVKQRFDIPISVDTSKAGVMKAAIDAGAEMINDVRALQDPETLSVCADSNVAVCLMHMQGQPRTMQANPSYDDVVQDIKSFLESRIESCEQVGIHRQRLIIDPGFGFGKTLQHNLSLLDGLADFQTLGLPILVGVSRKSMIGALLNDAPVEQRVVGSVAAALLAAQNGANILRVHDVKATVDAITIWQAVKENSHG